MRCLCFVDFARALLLVSVLVSFVSSSSASESILFKEELSNEEAVCNDGSKAVFYVGAKPSNKWIIFFESGGLCSTAKECSERYHNKETTVLMTSETMPNHVEGKDFLSADEIENPQFHDYSRVLVPYCSSDLWLGSRSNSHNVDAGNFSFRGRTIFQTVIKDLIDRHNLTRSSVTVLAGSSAGAIGVLNHATWVKKELTSRNSNTELLALADSGWFINFKDSMKARAKPEFAALAGINTTVLPACADISLGYSCCMSASCMISRKYFPSDLKSFVVSSLYDIYMLADVLKGFEDEGKTVEDNAADYASVVSMYGGAMSESLIYTKGLADNLSYFAPACFQHTYFSTSSLWGKDGLLQPLVEVTRGSGRFTHKIESGTWINTKLKSDGKDVTLRDAVTMWMQNGSAPVRLTDTCVGAHCNPTCPDELVFFDPGAAWEDIVRYVIIGLSLVMTVFCLTLKLGFMGYYSYLVRSQRKYLWESETLKARKELPPCEPSDAISISCSSLDYVVEATKKKSYDKAELVEAEDKSFEGKNHSINKDVEAGVFIVKDDPFAGSDSESTRSNSDCDETQGDIEEACTKFLDNDVDGTKARKAEDEQNGNARDDGKKNVETVDSVEDNVLKKTATNLGKENIGKRGDVVIDIDEGPDDVFGSGSSGSHLPLVQNQDQGDISCVDPLVLNPSKKQKKQPQVKQILSDISAYFNPGELVAIMGPSGCGKTTFLDLLTSRRKTGHMKGDVFINGLKMTEVQDWYARNIGYVLQLAVPYYEELTVRQNLTFAAYMRLPKSSTRQEKFERVEQVIAETGLSALADTVVGGSVGMGLSGGQKRRLCVAIQLINMPPVVFLDEPTSGLDATSSLELLNHLNLVAETGRLVLLTIHQPRLEIFHLFHKILFLCEGKVAYYGEPSMAPATFLQAYVEATTEEFRESSEAPKIDAKNPADTIMDILGCTQARHAILEYYQSSGEPQAIQQAINMCKQSATKTDTMDTTKSFSYDAGILNRLFVLESRASLKQTLGQIMYFPLIFFMFGVIIGTVYWQAEERDGILLMSAYCVYCCASPLFLSSVLMAHLSKALDMYRLERADGFGRSHENVIQTYVRTTAINALPVIMCSVMTYFMVMTSYDLWKLFFVTVISLVLNQTWIAVYTLVICANPNIAHRICPMVSAIGGFAGGFLVPRPQMPVGYNLLFYINPQFYGYSAITKVLLQNTNLNCDSNSTLNCVSTNGNAVLSRFGFDEVNPYEHLVIMLGITAVCILLSCILLEARSREWFTWRKKSSTFAQADVKDTAKEATEVTEVGGSQDVVIEMEPKDKATRQSTESLLSLASASKLGLVSSDRGLHTIKLPCQKPRSETAESIFEEPETAVEGRDSVSPINRLKKKRVSKSSASRRERWLSTRQHVEERKMHFERRMTQVRKMARRVSVMYPETSYERRRQTMGGVEREQFAGKITRQRILSQGHYETKQRGLDPLNEDALNQARTQVQFEDQNAPVNTQHKKVGFLDPEAVDDGNEINEGGMKLQPCTLDEVDETKGRDTKPPPYTLEKGGKIKGGDTKPQPCVLGEVDETKGGGMKLQPCTLDKVDETYGGGAKQQPCTLDKGDKTVGRDTKPQPSNNETTEPKPQPCALGEVDETPGGDLEPKPCSLDETDKTYGRDAEPEQFGDETATEPRNSETPPIPGVPSSVFREEPDTV